MGRFFKRIVRAATGGLGGALGGAALAAATGGLAAPALLAGAGRGAIGGAIAGGLGARGVVPALAGAASQHFLSPAAGNGVNMANGQWINPNQGANPAAQYFLQPGNVVGQNGVQNGQPNFLQQAGNGLSNLFGSGNPQQNNGTSGGFNLGGLGGMLGGAALGAGAMQLMNRNINPNAAGVGVGGRNPAINAMPYLNQVGAIGQEAYNPFIQQGQQAQGMANPIYDRMAQNPEQFINEMQQNYSPSEGYRFKEREMLRAAQNSAAQGGFSGTRNDQMSQADLVRGLLGEDMQQYLANVSGLRQTGLQGQEGRIGRGFESAGSLADYLGSNLGQQANMVFTGEGGENLLAHQAGMQNAINRMSRKNAMMGALGNLPGLFGAMR